MRCCYTLLCIMMDSSEVLAQGTLLWLEVQRRQHQERLRTEAIAVVAGGSALYNELETRYGGGLAAAAAHHGMLTAHVALTAVAESPIPRLNRHEAPPFLQGATPEDWE